MSARHPMGLLAASRGTALTDEQFEKALAGHGNSQSDKIRLKGERKAVSEEIAAERAKLKVIGLKQTDVNVAIRLLELEAEDRNESLNNIRTCFRALGLGGQGELFPPSGSGPDDGGFDNPRAASGAFADALN